MEQRNFAWGRVRDAGVEHGIARLMDPYLGTVANGSGCLSAPANRNRQAQARPGFLSDVTGVDLFRAADQQCRHPRDNRLPAALFSPFVFLLWIDFGWLDGVLRRVLMAQLWQIASQLLRGGPAQLCCVLDGAGRQSRQSFARVADLRAVGFVHRVLAGSLSSLRGISAPALVVAGDRQRKLACRFRLPALVGRSKLWPTFDN